MATDVDHARAPLLIIVGGPNGAGKSTFTARYLRDRHPGLTAVNPDDIAREIDPDNPEAAAVKAGMEAVRRMRRLVAARTSFLVETTLSGAFHLNLAEAAKAEGWEVELYFIFVQDPETSIGRVATRVAAGGHDVPADDIRRRYGKALANLQRFVEIAEKCRYSRIASKISATLAATRPESGILSTRTFSDGWKGNERVDAKSETSS